MNGLKHFKRNLPLRIICDASKEGLETVLQQQTRKGWVTTHFASRFLTTFEQKYSINDLQLYAVVWSIENFKNYVYGTESEVVSDHKALMTVLKDNMASKTYSSRLTRWVDRLLPLQFKVVHAAGRTMGMTDYLSRHPSPSNKNEQKMEAEELWNNWFTVNETTKCKIVSEKPSQQNTTQLPIKLKLASENEMQESVKESNEAESTNVKKTIREVVATIKPAVSSDCVQETDD